MKFSHNILHTYSFILSIIKHNWKIRRFWVVDPLKGRSARKVGRRGAAEVVWGEGGSSGGWGIEISVGIPAKLESGWGRHGKMQKKHGKAGCNGEQGKDCYWEDFNASIGRGGERRGYVGSMVWVGVMRQAGI